MEDIRILMRVEDEGGQKPTQEEIEKYRHERQRESEGGRKGGQRSHGGGRIRKQE
jgi:general stress protein YciG